MTSIYRTNKLDKKTYRKSNPITQTINSMVCFKTCCCAWLYKKKLEVEEHQITSLSHLLRLALVTLKKLTFVAGLFAKPQR